MGLKEITRRLATRAGCVVHRWPANRFDAMDAAREMPAARGYRPRVAAFLGAHGFVRYDIDMASSRPRDLRLRIGDVIFVRRGSPLAEAVASE